MSELDPLPWAYEDNPSERENFQWGHNLNWGPFVAPEFRPRPEFEQEFEVYIADMNAKHPPWWMRGSSA